jgi:cyclophilin family peptidyl-prolyl cis-trans isomerase/HEAT repeat protein
MSLLLALACSGACASAPRPASLPAPAVQRPSLDTRVSWILRLEQQRILRDSPAEAASAPAPVAGGADLVTLLGDDEALVRARAALAVGRVGLPEGRAPLEALLGDTDEAVRSHAAFALGLLGTVEAAPALRTQLADPSLVVRGRVIEALGMIGDRGAGPAIVQALADCPAWLGSIAPDDEAWPQAPPVEACRLAIYALVRLQDFDAVAALTLGPGGQPVGPWWPVAFGLQRLNDRRALPALRSLANVDGIYTPAFALRGLTALEDADSLPRARALVTSAGTDVKVRVAALRLLGRIGTAADAKLLVGLLSQEPAGSPLAIEATMALGGMRAPEAFDALVDGIASTVPAMRAASMAAAARLDPDAFLLVLAGLNRDRDWQVRAALAEVLGTLPADRVTPALVDLSADEDARVHGAALRALASLKVPDLIERLTVALQASDFSTRATAATLLGEARPPDGLRLLEEAYVRGDGDSAYGARLAAIEAMAVYGEAAVAGLQRALTDREWPIRLRAAQLLRTLKVDAAAERPAPVRWPASFFESDALLHPPYSPRAFIETRRGVIEVQLEIADAPLAVATFVEQVRNGLFNGLPVHRLIPGFVIQTGDPRGDGTGGPGYSQRDEFTVRPFLRGSVGLASAGPETAGSQWFITTAPQPHLDGRYTNIGRVVGGWDVLDRMGPGDLIERVRIWDGVDLR